jgi:hypothetical protein
VTAASINLLKTMWKESADAEAEPA